MILYCTSLPIFLYHLTVHKLTVDKEKDVVLMVDEKMFKTRNLAGVLDRLKDQGIFHDVILSDLYMNRKLSSDNALEQEAISHFDELFENCRYPIASFDEIYVMNDTHDGEINLYFNLKQIGYKWLQPVENHCVIESNAAWLPKPFVSVMAKHKAFSPLAAYAQPCIWDTSEETKELLEEENKPYTTWNLRTLLDTLGKSEINQIANAFEIDQSGSYGDSSLVIKNSYGYSQRTFSLASKYEKLSNGYNNYDSHNVYAMLDKMALDIYAPEADKVFIKSHPNDPMGEELVQEIYGKNVSPFSHMPFEFVLKYFEENHIQLDTLIGYASSSLKNTISPDICRHLFVLGDDYFRTYCYYVSIFVSLFYAAYSGISKIYTQDKIKSQIDLMVEAMGLTIETEEIKTGQLKNYRNAIVIFNRQNQIKYEFTMLHPTVTALFINTDARKEFFEEDIAECFVPIVIKKERISGSSPDFLMNETIWLYSKKMEVRKEARDFSLVKNMNFTGIKLVVDAMTISECTELFYQNSELCYTHQISGLLRTCETLKRRNDILTDLIAFGNDPQVYRTTFSKINGIYEYLDFLKVVKSKYAVIVSTKDTPGNCLEADVINALHDIGFTAFNSELWKMYVGVSVKGKVLCDKISDAPKDPVRYEGIEEQVSFEVESMAWKSGNASRIRIDQTDYSCNGRGINIVVYDTDSKCIVDSVNYDAHANADGTFKRKQF